MLTVDQPVAIKAALRHDTIRRAIEVSGRVSIADLKDRLDVSEVTIREDLKFLESKGVLTRVRGGAVVSRDGPLEMSLEETSTTNRSEKMAIAARAAAMVDDGQTIIIDVGSTTTELAKALSPELSRVVVITNGLNIALILEGLPGVSVIVTGGTLRPLQHSLVAPMGTLLIDQLKADVAFLGCNGVDTADSPTATLLKPKSSRPWFGRRRSRSSSPTTTRSERWLRPLSPTSLERIC
jgi:DeoR family transcriptional regulator of aga operon